MRGRIPDVFDPRATLTFVADLGKRSAPRLVDELHPQVRKRVRTNDGAYIKFEVVLAEKPELDDVAEVERRARVQAKAIIDAKWALAQKHDLQQVELLQVREAHKGCAKCIQEKDEKVMSSLHIRLERSLTTSRSRRCRPPSS